MNDEIQLLNEIRCKLLFSCEPEVVHVAHYLYAVLFQQALKDRYAAELIRLSSDCPDLVLFHVREGEHAGRR